MNSDHLVVFTPSGKRGRFAAGTSVLDAARALGADLDSVCGGRGICGRCQVLIAEGEFAKHGIRSASSHVSAWNAVEERYAERRGQLAAGRRLGCQAALCGDLVVDVPADSQVHRQVVRKPTEVRDIAIDPVVRLHYVELREAGLDDASSDFSRLQAALAEQWSIADARAELTLLHALQSVLKLGPRLTVAVRDGRDIVAIWPGLRDKAYGVAVDIGSTTIAAQLAELASGEVLAAAGAMNPQIRFGEDLMSRVSYAMLNANGAAEMTAAVRTAVNELIGTVAAQAKIDRDDVVEITAVGNPIMHHLFLGLDPTQLGAAPFALTVDRALSTPAHDVGLTIASGAFVYTLPCIAGHVGADAAGVVLAEAPQNRDELTLVVDVGTNAEILLGNRQRLLACSSPTGPAFEGAQISSGQRAAPGAIERLRIDRATLEPRFKVIGCDLWSNDEGFEKAVARTGVTGICGSGIIEAVAELYLAGVIRSDGVIDGDMASRSSRVVSEGRTFSFVIRDAAPRIAVTQADVRAIQLAKAALHAGVKLLMDRIGSSTVDRIRLAGAFGSHIDVTYAMVLGLIPDCDIANVSSAGNAAGTGARIALLNNAARREIEALVKRIEKIETAIEPRFQAHFIDAMAFPHSTDRYEKLQRVIQLPPRSASRAGSERSRAGRRPPRVARNAR